MATVQERSVIKGTYAYHILNKIAEGGMGTVYEVEQRGTEGFVKRMALKAITSHHATNAEFVSMFIGEARLVAQLVHPNIVQIYHLDRTEGGQLFLAMEYIDGINLEQFLIRHIEQKCQIPLDIATFIVARVARGLEFAHQKRDQYSDQPLHLVHRDISPKNIMITSEGEVKLTDFGIAKALNYLHQDEERVLMGGEYMSPEQAAFQVTDARSDLFSLGVVYLELLTCRNDYLGEDIGLTLNRIKRAVLPEPRRYRPEIPEDMERILLRALQREPKARYASAGEMVYDLEYYIYHRGYGPTITSLARYAAELFPERHFYVPPQPKTTIIYNRSPRFS